jgi:6-pyruvoyltetrahydropterin/6-carboxytetrahydropterin synthase
MERGANSSKGGYKIKPNIIRHLLLDTFTPHKSMKTVYITRREHFNAAHKLWNEEWSAEKNLEVFGKCSNPNWHGHNYTLQVTVKGVPDAVTGFVINLKELSKIIKSEVLDPIDHRNLNIDVPFMKGIQPSTENLAIAIWERIADQVASRGGKLHSVKLWETENNSVEYFGEE